MISQSIFNQVSKMPPSDARRIDIVKNSSSVLSFICSASVHIARSCPYRHDDALIYKIMEYVEERSSCKKETNKFKCE